MPEKKKRLKLEEAYERLKLTCPTGYRTIPDRSLYDGRFASLRVATPFSYPDGEEMYVYIEVNDGTTQLMRLYDDEVFSLWLKYQDLFPALHRIHKTLREEIFAPAGMKLLLSEGQEVIYNVSMTRHIDSVWAAMPAFCENTLQAIKMIKREKAGYQALGKYERDDADFPMPPIASFANIGGRTLAVA